VKRLLQAVRRGAICDIRPVDCGKIRHFLRRILEQMNGSGIFMKHDQGVGKSGCSRVIR